MAARERPVDHTEAQSKVGCFEMQSECRKSRWNTTLALAGLLLVVVVGTVAWAIGESGTNVRQDEQIRGLVERESRIDGKLDQILTVLGSKP